MYSLPETAGISLHLMVELVLGKTAGLRVREIVDKKDRKEIKRIWRSEDMKTVRSKNMSKIRKPYFYVLRLML